MKTRFRSDRRRNAALAAAAGAATLALLAAPGCSKSSGAPQGPPQMPPAPVRTVAPTVGEVSVYREYPANTRSPRTVDIIPRVTGWVDTQGFVDGQMVEEGQLLYVIDPRPYQVAVEKAKADIAIVEADLRNATDKVARNRPLLESGAVSRQDFDQFVANERSLTATLQARRAALDDANLNLSFTRIVSPLRGQASATTTYPGTYVTPATTLTNLQQLDPLLVEFEPVVAELPRLRELQASGERSTEVVLPGSGWTGKGKVVFIDNAANPRTGTIRARLEVENKDGGLAPGAYVSVRLQTQTMKDAVSVPETVLVYQTAAATLWTVDAKGIAHQHVVKLGPRGGAGIVVLEGLPRDAMVVCEGMQKLAEGAQTIPPEALRQMMQQPPAGAAPGGQPDAKPDAPAAPPPAAPAEGDKR